MDVILKSTRNLPWVLDLIKDHHDTMPDELKPKNLSDLGDRLTTWYKIMIGNIPVGMTAYQHITPNLAYVKRTIVHPDHRNMGVAKAAWILMEDILKKNGYGKAFCHVFSTNTAMVNVRVKAGFVIEGLLKDHDALGIHCYVLGKKL